MNEHNFMLLGFLIVAYLVGSIPNGWLAGKLIYRKDIRKEGSGNIGATNALRSFGTLSGVLVLLLDMAKGFIPVGLAILITSKESSLVPITAFLVIMGHIFPVYLKFKGGKGVATAAGSFLAFAPYSLLIAIIVFLIVVILYRYVSLASICAALSFQTHYLAQLLKAEKADFVSLILISVVIMMILIKHQSNLERLLRGTESKLKFGKKGN
ncbi:MAG: glycerol-3-phosphate 1-O-acyltransferase PlsY [Candidatus Cloacimonas sp.]